jgi:DNA processing protein
MHRTMDFKTLFALALQDSGIKPRDIISTLSNVDFTAMKSISDLRDYISHSAPIKSFPSEKSWNYAVNIDELNAKYGIKSFSILSKGYPKHLKAIDNPPAVLHVRGSVEILQDINGVAIVGSRKTSNAGLVIAQRIASQAVSQNWVVVSGLALGIDAAAHSGALSVGRTGATVAVLAHGLEKAKPIANKTIGDAILENGGAWVSEHAVGTPAKPAQFVSRNRIQLGLSVGSIIVEAEEKSGSITQARFCVQQNRPLFAVVPEDLENRLGLVCAGTQMLVSKMGANPIKSRNDYPFMFERFERQQRMMRSL